MRCEEAQDLLDLHLDRELTEELHHKLERHLLRCAACSYEARTLEQTRIMLREAVSVEEPSPGFRERSLAHLIDTLAVHRPEPIGAGRQWKLPFNVETGD